MALLLFIVSRDAENLLGSLRQEFAAEPDVEVILDRRLRGDPHDPSGAHERRRRPEIDEQLHALGWAIAHPAGR